MKSMRAVLPAALAAAALAAGCGGGDGGGAREGGTITVAQTSQPDSLDPALASSIYSSETNWLIYTPLVTYRHAEAAAGSELIPGLAEALPEVSEDGRTYRLRLREGLSYSDGRPVRASDFEHSIKRVLALQSAGSSFFFGIEGAQAYAEGGDRAADIPGIGTDDASRQITIRLTDPDATFSNILALVYAGVVPGDTPFSDQSASPPAGVGAYMYTDSRPGSGWTLRRTPDFDLPGVPAGKIEEIRTRIISSQQRQTEEVIANRLDYTQVGPSADLLPRVRAEHADRYRETVINSTAYIWMNSRVAPFDDVRVRQAVGIASDPTAIVRIVAGQGAPTCNFLPPNMLGYEALDPCPFGDVDAPRDLERARALVREAGHEDTQVTVWGYTDTFGPRLSAYIADVLDQIGLRAEVRSLTFGVFAQSVGNQETRAQIGDLGWFQDFPHPANFMQLVDGANIQPVNNQNLSNTDDPVINEGIRRLQAEPDLPAVADQWAALDRRVVEEAHLVPLINQTYPTFLSERMDFEDCVIVHPVYGNDLSSFCLK